MLPVSLATTQGTKAVTMMVWFDFKNTVYSLSLNKRICNILLPKF